MFEGVGTRNRLAAALNLLAFLVSVAVHFTVVAVLVIVPMVFFSAMPDMTLLSFVFANPTVPPPPLPQIVREFGGTRVAKLPEIREREYRAPGRIPDGIPAPVDEPMIVNPIGVQFGAGGRMPTIPGGVVGAPLAFLAPPPPVPIPPPPVARKTAIRVSMGVQQAKLLKKVAPEYPPLAHKTRVSGNVVLEVHIDEEGSVIDIRVLEGHPLLREAAVKAVEQWKYSPTLLSGEPVPVVATVTVMFRLLP